MKYSELHGTINSLRQMADWLESNPKAIELPKPDFYINNYVYKYPKDENGYIDYSTSDEFATRLAMREIAKALGSSEKSYIGESFQLIKKFGSINWKFQTSRKSICRAVVTETKEIPEEIIPSKVIPARTEEVIEWVCDDPLLATK